VDNKNKYKYTYSKERRQAWQRTWEEKKKNKPFIVYKVGDRIAIYHGKIEPVLQALEAYYESLSNFACKPIHKVVELATFKTRKEAQKYIETEYKTIRKIESPLHSGKNMDGLTEEKFSDDYKLTCPVCQRSGYPTKYWLANHFDTCIYKDRLDDLQFLGAEEDEQESF
jgi:hypothetical protein